MAEYLQISGNGPNALDFHITFSIGELSKADPDARFYIISWDTGFDPLPEEAKRAHAASLPLKRLGTTEDMVSAYVFLASAEAAYYCGQLLHPNGGEIMP